MKGVKKRHFTLAAKQTAMMGAFFFVIALLKVVVFPGDAERAYGFLGTVSLVAGVSAVVSVFFFVVMLLNTIVTDRSD